MVFKTNKRRVIVAVKNKQKLRRQLQSISLQRPDGDSDQCGNRRTCCCAARLKEFGFQLVGVSVLVPPGPN